MTRNSPFLIPALIVAEKLILAAIVVATPVYRALCWLEDVRHPDDPSAWDATR